MSLDIFGRLNWVDIFLCLILVRAVYIGLRSGFVIELFKLIGIFFAVVISLHYFSGASHFLQEKVHLPESAANFASLGFLWGVVVLAFKFIREGIMLLFKVEAHSALNSTGGFIASVVRGFLIGSLAILLLRSSATEYFTKNIANSFGAEKMAGAAPRVYEATYKGFVSKFFPSEEFNKSVSSLANVSEGQGKKKDKK